MHADTTQRRDPGARRRKGSRKSLAINALAIVTVAGFAGWTATLAMSLSYPRLDTPASSLLVAVHEMRADDALTDPTTAPGISAIETRRALALAPATSSAWLRLAYLDYVAKRRITSAGVDYINRSFEVAPFGPDVSPWRIRFLFENWTALPPSVRERAIAELETLSRYRGYRALAVTEGITSPEGALAGRMITARARAHDPR